MSGQWGSNQTKEGGSDFSIWQQPRRGAQIGTRLRTNRIWDGTYKGNKWSSGPHTGVHCWTPADFKSLKFLT